MASTTSSTASHTNGPRRLRGSTLAVARTAWIAVAALYLVVFLFALPRIYDAQFFGNFVSIPQVRANLNASGLGVTGYAWLQLTLSLLLSTISCLVGIIIFWRRSDQPQALFVSIVLVAAGCFGGTNALRGTDSAWHPIATFLTGLAVAAIAPFFFLFPDGRWVPRWTRWLALYWAVVQFVGNVVAPTSYMGTPLSFVMGWGWLTSVLSGLVAIPFAQIYRYRRVSGPAERQQIKWVVFGVVLFFIPALASGILPVLFPDVFAPGSLLYVVGQVLIGLALLTIPLSIGMAVARYRLWDVDPLINRALVYVTLTGSLALVYFGAVVLLQEVLRGLTGTTESSVAVVASTLAIAALFQPLRRRIQSLIDRRFYRRRYNAARTLDRFGSRLRDRVDLADLTEDLVETVKDTLQPAHVSLWLLPAPGRRSQSVSEAPDA